MKFTKRQSFLKPKTLEKCYRIVKNKAYFQLSLDQIFYYEFENINELKQLQIKRIKENMKSRVVDDWECCDEHGLFSFFKMSRIKHNRLNAYEKESMLIVKGMTQKDEYGLDDWEIKFLENINNFYEIKAAQFLNEELSDEEFWRVYNNAEKFIAEFKK